MNEENELEEIIESISEFDEHGKKGNYEGFRIDTNKQTIEIKISNLDHCCERWGHICSQDDLSSFIGSIMKEIVVVNEKIVQTKVKLEKIDKHNDELFAIFVNVITNQGTLQFTLYNQHNGYYGHFVIISSIQLKVKKKI